MRPFSLTASHGLCLSSSVSHTFTLALPSPPPSHPSASLLLNLESPPLSLPPSSHLLSLSYSPATCHRSLLRSSLQTVDPLPSFFFFFASFLALCFTRRLSFSRATSPVPGPLLCQFEFYQKKRNLHIKLKSRKWALCHFNACPSERFHIISKITWNVIFFVIYN